MKALSCAALLALASCSPSPEAAETAEPVMVRPGMYESDWSAFGVSFASLGKDAQRKCVSGDPALFHRQLIKIALPSDSQCTLGTVTRTGNRVRGETSCADDGFGMKASFDGVVRDDRMRGRVTIKVTDQPGGLSDQQRLALKALQAKDAVVVVKRTGECFGQNG